MTSPIDVSNSLEYYLHRKPSQAEVEDAMEWMEGNPDVNLDEYVSAMIEIGAL